MYQPDLYQPGDGANSGGGGSSLARWMVGAWRRQDMPANSTIVPARATGQATSVMLEQDCTLIGFTCSLNNLGLIDAVAGSPLVINAIRTSKAGVADAAVTIASIAVGESNVVRTVLNQIDFSAGDCVHLQFVTDSSFTSTTNDPCVRLEFEAR